MYPGAERTAIAALRRKGSTDLLASGPLVTPLVVYVAEVVDSLGDETEFEVLVVAPDSRRVERLSPTSVDVVRVGEGTGFTLVHLASASEYVPPPQSARGLVDLVIDLDDALSARAATQSVDQGDDTVADLVPRTLLVVEADPFPTDLIAVAAPDDGSSAAVPVQFSDIGTTADIIEFLCKKKILHICEVTPDLSDVEDLGALEDAVRRRREAPLEG